MLNAPLVRGFATLVLAAAVAGCSSAPVAESGDGEEFPATREGSLQVVVWSNALQRPIPARGEVLAVDAGRRWALDTRSDPRTGQSFLRLPPGRYRVRVTQRALAGGGDRRASGEALVYLEPGSTRRVTVVALDLASEGDVEETLPASTPGSGPAK
ncbi:MAG: hypothetical protein D6731_23515 [Planctomycetota bacterium]|nr:MAG: hypothetical protein D6731_23515 [Planctomycetota bacterium]